MTQKMTTQKMMTMNEIRQIGLEALLTQLGPVGMIRFLHQFETGKGNYSVDRHQWLTVDSVEALVKEIHSARANQPRTTPRK